jgi:hypothetical protein
MPNLEANKAIALADAHTGKNDRHHPIGTLRQSVVARLTGYEDLTTPSVCGMIQQSAPSAGLARRP